jgi:hypothetical protein
MEINADLTLLMSANFFTKAQSKKNKKLYKIKVKIRHFPPFKHLNIKFLRKKKQSIGFIIIKHLLVMVTVIQESRKCEIKVELQHHLMTLTFRERKFMIYFIINSELV